MLRRRPDLRRRKRKWDGADPCSMLRWSNERLPRCTLPRSELGNAHRPMGSASGTGRRRPGPNRPLPGYPVIPNEPGPHDPSAARGAGESAPRDQSVPDPPWRSRRQCHPCCRWHAGRHRADTPRRGPSRAPSRPACKHGRDCRRHPGRQLPTPGASDRGDPRAGPQSVRDPRRRLARDPSRRGRRPSHG